MVDSNSCICQCMMSNALSDSEHGETNLMEHVIDTGEDSSQTPTLCSKERT